MPDRKNSKPRDGRRKREGATTALMNASVEGVVVLVVDDVLTKNERYRLTRIGKRAGMAESTLAKKFKRAVAEAAVKMNGGEVLLAPVIAKGAWHLEVLTVWPTQRHHACGLKTANGDDDASVSMVKDALQAAGVLDDDMRIVTTETASIYRKGERRVIAQLHELIPGIAEERGDSLLEAEQWVRREAKQWAAKS